MNGAAKGTRLEREFENKLKAAGHVTHRAIKSKFNRNDIWGCFDVMSKHPKAPDKTWYFQVSTRWKFGKDRIEIESFPKGIYDEVYMVRRKDNKDFEYMHLTSVGWTKLEGFKGEDYERID